jgi:hypothetical protein
MKKNSLLLAMALSVAAVAPAAAWTSPVSNYELNRFIGTNLHGSGFSNLGVVAAASRQMGTVAVVGRHGELATIHASMLVKDGMRLRAPELSHGHIMAASWSPRRPIIRGGEVFIEDVSTYNDGTTYYNYDEE